MSVRHLGNRAGNLCRRISRWFGAPEISQRRIRKFLDQAPVDAMPLRSDTTPKTLAVVIPCYGHAAFLSEALESIARQTRLPDEVIAVDDHSPDTTGTILQEQLSRLRELKGVSCALFSNERNMGQAYSLNRGIAAAKSELIMILNDDDYLMHDAVAMMFELFVRHRDVAMIGGTSVLFSSADELERHLRKGCAAAGAADAPVRISQPADVLGYARYNDLNMAHSGCCFLKSAWERVGGYYPDKRKRLVPFSDRDFQLRVNAHFPVAVSDTVPFAFWRSGSSVDQGRDS